MDEEKARITSILSANESVTLNQLLRLYKETYGVILPYTGSFKQYLVSLDFECGPDDQVSVKPAFIASLKTLLREKGFVRLNQLSSEYQRRFGSFSYSGKLKTFLIEKGFDVTDDDTVRLKVTQKDVKERLAKICRENPTVRGVNSIIELYRESYGTLVYGTKLKSFLESVGYTIDRNNNLRCLERASGVGTAKKDSDDVIRKNIDSVLKAHPAPETNHFLSAYKASFGPFPYDGKFKEALESFGYTVNQHCIMRMNPKKQRSASAMNLSTCTDKCGESKLGTSTGPKGNGATAKPLNKQEVQNNMRTLLQSENSSKHSTVVLRELYNAIFSPPIDHETCLQILKDLDCVSLLDANSIVIYGEIANACRARLKELGNHLLSSHVAVDDLKVFYENVYRTPLVYYGNLILALTSEGYVCNNSFVDLPSHAGLRLPHSPTRNSLQSSMSMINLVDSRVEAQSLSKLPYSVETEKVEVSDLVIKKIECLLSASNFLEYPGEVLLKYKQMFGQTLNVPNTDELLCIILKRTSVFVQTDGAGAIFMSFDASAPQPKGNQGSISWSPLEGEGSEVDSDESPVIGSVLVQGLKNGQIPEVDLEELKGSLKSLLEQFMRGLDLISQEVDDNIPA